MLYSAFGEALLRATEKLNFQSIITTTGLITIFIYVIWAIGQFYQEKVWGYLKGLLAYILGALSFYFLGAILIMVYNKII